ncbi:hypothetical protein M409DRAFT_56323 [Zasmidium cellare ATCC 36951]|uniref:Hydrophobin n=1 Tax=Zasmidium cellare ATCC 36951 TaxID=1080233 RepID=A0A6A6CCQ4_ZASCE|nr:uncharacterized protein M409DRAFT_56323 [Zasmidium cellare ATCC 36951]KAF2164977.1 hypothetical protein M409DRAFT_56323 [Zasmidium cellare ATCC 36951]
MLVTFLLPTLFAASIIANPVAPAPAAYTGNCNSQTALLANCQPPQVCCASMGGGGGCVQTVLVEAEEKEWTIEYLSEKVGSKNTLSTRPPTRLSHAKTGDRRPRDDTRYTKRVSFRVVWYEHSAKPHRYS